MLAAEGQCLNVLVPDESLKKRQKRDPCGCYLIAAEEMVQSECSEVSRRIPTHCCT